MLPSKKTSKSRTRTRRAHDALKQPKYQYSSEIGALHRPHCAIETSGSDGRVIAKFTNRAKTRKERGE